GMTIDPAMGRLSWTPGTSDIGTKAVTIRAVDGRGGSSEQHYVLAVVAPPPNRPPVFTSVPVVQGQVHAAYTYDADATDADGDSLTFSVVAGPQGLSVNSASGGVSWTPIQQQVGDQQVILQVSDGRGGTAT